ncbi:hypothetical protein PT974_03659 [Cladobotryum mycophilum]|uniref:Uncharacterized protein n=1 Tax=Cladobotryum mycophilum TaxID=491253 RepID=A0ABR0SSX3_9HYPO
MLFKPLSLVFLAASALADTGILSSAKLFQNDIAAMTRQVDGWQGGIIGAVPLAGSYFTTLSHAYEGLDVAKAASPLSAADTSSLLAISTDISDLVDKAMNTVIAAKSKTGSIPGLPFFLRLNLGIQRQLVNDFCNLVLLKIPTDAQPDFKALIAKNDASFARAINSY